MVETRIRSLQNSPCATPPLLHVPILTDSRLGFDHFVAGLGRPLENAAPHHSSVCSMTILTIGGSPSAASKLSRVQRRCDLPSSGAPAFPAGDDLLRLFDRNMKVCLWRARSGSSNVTVPSTVIFARGNRPESPQAGEAGTDTKPQASLRIG
jgi:hypothetical protein